MPSSDYLSTSKRPWPSLVFLLPMIIAYEVGTVVFARDHVTGAETRIVAFNLLSQFLAWFGGTGRFLPAVAVIVILLCLHVAHKDDWGFPPKTMGGMAAESMAWAVPLLAIAYLTAHYIPLQSPTLESKSLPALIVLSLGAGIYEELIFRLVAFAAMSWVLADVLKLSPKVVMASVLIGSSVGFSLYHYLGDEPFELRAFVFRTVAGLFFGVLYLCRGFGVTAGAHAAYDVMVALLRG